MPMIYEPKGAAREYAPLALNIYTGCQHACTYCYNKKIPWLSEGYFDGPRLKADVIPRVMADADRLRKAKCTDEILLSFVGDPYQPAEMDLRITREVIKILIENRLNFTILTKAGLRAVRDFDILDGYPGFRFGTSLVFFYQEDADHWEPGAASIKERIQSIGHAKAYGFKTWVSLEPVIDPGQALMIIRDLFQIVDFWAVGKINHHPEIEKQVDWPEFRDRVTKLFEALEANFLIKESLKNV